MASPAPRYTYTPISQPGRIRLLTLEPGLETDPIRCSLAPVLLDQNPEYEALSYCWGDPTLAYDISCNGKALAIPANLHSALCSLRKEDSARTLWIDALCINQEDIHEKGRQIQLATGIYSQATRVVLYLGNDSSDLQGLEVFMSSALQLLPEETYDNSTLSVTTTTFLEEAQRLEADGGVSWRTLNWTPYLNLLKRPWFSRKWIIQEVAFAKQAVAVCGDLSVPWAELATIAFRATQYDVLLEVLPGRDPADWACQYANHNAHMLLLIGFYRGQGGLLDLVLATQLFACTVPQDHVFSLLSLAKDPRKSSLVPDYTLSVGEVFRRFAVAAILEGGSLNIFSIAPGEPWQDDGAMMPSWVPDLRRPNPEPLTGYSVRPRQFFSGGAGVPVVEVLTGGKALRCRGIIVDTIQTVLDYTLLDRVANLDHTLLDHIARLDCRVLDRVAKLDYALLDRVAETPVPREGRPEILNRTNRAVANWVLHCQSLAGIDLREDIPLQQRRVFCRALMCDQTGMRDRLADDVVDGLLTHLRQFIDLAAKDAAETAQTQFSQRYLGQFRQSLAMADQKKFCVTEAGRYGQAARMARGGDRVVVFLGAEVPTIVRPAGAGAYSVVGECYLTGVMDGEVLGKGGEEDIILE